MARKVNITCRYYLVKKYTDTDNEKEALFDLRKWIAEVKDMTLSERVKELGGSGKGRIDSIKIEVIFMH